MNVAIAGDAKMRFSKSFSFYFVSFYLFFWFWLDKSAEVLVIIIVVMVEGMVARLVWMINKFCQIFG